MRFLAAVVPASMGWNDVDSWTALKGVQPNDEVGNAARGDVFLKSVKNTLIRAEHRFVAAVGGEAHYGQTWRKTVAANAPKLARFSTANVATIESG